MLCWRTVESIKFCGGIGVGVGVVVAGASSGGGMRCGGEERGWLVLVVVFMLNGHGGGCSGRG